MCAKQNRSSRRTSGLRGEYLSYPEVFAQSIATIVPSAMPTVVLPLVFASAGNASWLAYLLATLSIIFVCLTLNQFTQRAASSGSLYGYVALGIGQIAGFLAAWSLLLCYGLGVIVSTCGFAIYGNVLLNLIGWHSPSLLLYGVCIGVAGYVAYRDIKLSSVFLLVMEALSLGLILFVAGAVFVQHRFVLDLPQITLQQTTWSGMTFGLVLALLSFVGFESAATLGDEAKHPRRTIPRALLGSTITTGVFFTVMAYVIVLGFRGYTTPLNLSDAPLNVLADLAGIGVVGRLIAVGIVVSGFAAAIANLNAAARILLALAQQKVFFRWLGHTHHRNYTPHRAIAFVAVVAFLSAAPLFWLGVRPLDILGYSGVLLTDSYLFVYLLLAIAALAYLARLNQLRLANSAIAVGAILTMLIAVFNSLYPIPPFPYNLLPYLFLLWLASGGAWFLRRRVKSTLTLIPDDFTE